MLEKRFKNKDIYQVLLENTKNRCYQEVIRLLLLYYYDPRYGFKMNEYKNRFITIDADHVEDAVQEIQQYIETLPFTHQALTTN